MRLLGSQWIHELTGTIGSQTLLSQEAVVAQQPFGGARASGTNDKAGGPLNLLRWISPRSIKRTLDIPQEWGYPFLAPDE